MTVTMPCFRGVPGMRRTFCGAYRGIECPRNPDGFSRRPGVVDTQPGAALPFAALPFAALPFAALPFAALPFAALPFAALPFALLSVQETRTNF